MTSNSPARKGGGIRRFHTHSPGRKLLRLEPRPQGRGNFHGPVSIRPEIRSRCRLLLMRALALAALVLPIFAQQQQTNPNDQVLKALDDVEWRLKLGDIADVDKISYASLPPH